MKDTIEIYVSKFWELYNTQDKPIILFGNGDGVIMPLPIPSIPKEIELKFEGLTEQEILSRWVASILNASFEHGYLTSHPDSLVFHKSGLYLNILGRDGINE